MEQDGGFIELSTTADNWNHIVIDAGYSGWIGVDLQEGLQCKTTELADQTVDGNLGHMFMASASIWSSGTCMSAGLP